jgi:hypothetical protein
VEDGAGAIHSRQNLSDLDWHKNVCVPVIGNSNITKARRINDLEYILLTFGILIDHLALKSLRMRHLSEIFGGFSIHRGVIFSRI